MLCQIIKVSVYFAEQTFVCSLRLELNNSVWNMLSMALFVSSERVHRDHIDSVIADTPSPILTAKVGKYCVGSCCSMSVYGC